MMRHDSGKVLSSILKYLLKLLFVCLLLGILYYSFKDSMEDMITELSKVSPQVILVLFLSVVVYHLCEGHITWLIVHKTHPEYPRRKGFCNAFYCSFYKTATLIIPFVIMPNRIRSYRDDDRNPGSQCHRHVLFPIYRPQGLYGSL